jgi:hypothetical protein
MRKRCPATLDCDGMGSIPAIPEARSVPLLLCHERFNEAGLPTVPYTHAVLSQFHLFTRELHTQCTSINK